MVKGNKTNKKVVKETIESTPIELPDLLGRSFASTSSYRSNPNWGKSVLSNLENLDNLYSTVNDNFIAAKEMIELCRTAYKKVPVFKTSIDVMTDLANTPIHLEGGNKQSVDFFKAWLKRINDFKLKDQIFTETFRSGNTFLLRVESTMTNTEILKINSQNYAAKEVSIPTKYIILDSANICLQNAGYSSPIYYKILNRFEVDHLKRSSDDNDKQTYKSIKQAIDAYSKGGNNAEPLIELDPDKLHTIFYKKQDYEPFAVPMGYCVLDDINLSLEFKKADAVLAKTVEYAMLKVTMGAEPDKGGTNPKALAALKELYRNEKIGRVMIGDYTLEAEWIIPDLEKIMNPMKYEEVNRNIANGLMNIFFGEQKYADSVTKLRALSKRIENVQELFLNEFLNPEIKRISKQMNFKAYPIARMEPTRIEDQTNAQRVYAQLLQLGILSPQDGIELFESGLFPSYDTIETRQEGFRKQKEKGHFQPIQGGPFDNKELAKMNGEMKIQQQKISPPGGRPPGTKSKQTTKKVSQTGASIVSDREGFSQKKIAENTLKLMSVKASIEKEYKSVNKIKRLTNSQKEVIETVSNMLFENESPENWESKASEYVTQVPELSINMDVISELEEIKEEFQVDHQSALILYHSKA